MDEVMRFLQEQQAIEDAKFNKGAKTPPSMSNVARPAPPSLSNIPRGPMMSATAQFPQSTPSMGNVPARVTPPSGLSAGRFAGTVGDAARGTGSVIQKALGKVMAPQVSIPVSLLGKPAWDAGQALGDMALGQRRNGDEVVKNDSDRGRRMASERAYEGRSLPDMSAPPLKTESLRTPVQPAQAAQQAPARPAEKTALQESAALADMSDQITSPEEALAAEAGPEVETPAEAATDVIPDESSMETTSPEQTEDEQVMAAIQELLTAAPPPPVREETPGSSAVIDEVTKENPEPKETFGRKVKRFITAGSGPINFSRLDEQEAGARLAKGALTDKEKVKANLAQSDIEGSRSFNRASQLKREDTGGVTDRDKLQLGALMDQYKMATGERRAEKMAGIEHKNRMAEIGSSAANQRMSPEAQKRQAAYSAAEKNPDIFSADQLEQLFGIRPSPEALKVLQDARLKDNPMTVMLSEMLRERMANRMGSTSTAGKKPIAVRALEKQPEVKK